MMKSEWMSKQDVKKRLDSIFGEYSAFVVRPDDQQQFVQQSKLLENNYKSNKICKTEIIRDERQSNVDNQTQSSSNINSMIGQLVNISKPLSPVTFAQNESNQLVNGFEATKEDEFSNKSEKFGPDLDTILEQISRVSPLLSPIVNISASLNENNSDSLDNLKQEINAAITSKSDQNGSKNNLKRPNTDEDTSHIHISPKRHKDLHVEEQQYFTQKVIKKENNSSIYSIKLRSISLNKLLNKFYPQKELQEENELQQEIQSERSLDCSTANASTPTTQIDVDQAQNERGGNGRQSDNMSDQPTNISDCDFKIGFPSPDGKSPPFDFFQKNARDIRKRSDQEGDRILKLLFSFESLAYYIMASSTLTSKTEKMHSSIAENTNYLNSFWNSFKKQKITESKFLTSIRTRLKYLQMMISACLAYNLYSLRSGQALKTYTILQQYEKENPAISRRPTSRGATTTTTNNNINGINENGAALTTNGIGGAATCSTTTPSPGSSTPSSFNSQTTVTLPLEVYNSMFQQIKILNHLMWADKLWNDAESHAPQECKEFFERITNLCCGINQTSGLSTIAKFLLTTVQCLKKEYGDKT
ncbi:unnamed protein product [Meloidogyne enterolobii]|uniref:Uncharacterized protein n=1 Tax=Meloidogyne enterolobii TaxID=390850 RepID=A0ACB0ZFB5_MELEN